MLAVNHPYNGQLIQQVPVNSAQDIAAELCKVTAQHWPLFDVDVPGIKGIQASAGGNQKRLVIGFPGDGVQVAYAPYPAIHQPLV